MNAVTATGKSYNVQFFSAANYDINRIIQFNFGGTKGQQNIYCWKNYTYESGGKYAPFHTTTYNPVNGLTISCINDIWKVNNNTIKTDTSAGEWRDENNSLVLFGYSRIANNKKTIYPFYENLYVYSLKIWDNGELVRNYIPVVSFENEHENEACLYDLVGEKYYFNNGSGSFETN